jgi:hypothetical protein
MKRRWLLLLAAMHQANVSARNAVKSANALCLTLREHPLRRNLAVEPRPSNLLAKNNAVREESATVELLASALESANAQSAPADKKNPAAKVVTATVVLLANVLIALVRNAPRNKLLDYDSAERTFILTPLIL